MHHPTDRIIHTTAFVTPVVEHWLEWEIAQSVIQSHTVMSHTDIRRLAEYPQNRHVIIYMFCVAFFVFGKNINNLSNHSWCNKGCGMCHHDCEMVHIKGPLLLIRMSTREVAVAGFLSAYLSGPFPYSWHHLTINIIFWVHYSFLSTNVMSLKLSNMCG